MSLGKGIAIAGIWLGVGLVALGGGWLAGALAAIAGMIAAIFVATAN